MGKSAIRQVQLFAVYSDLTLFSDFTYFLDDPVRGDQFSQTDHRVILGGNATQARTIQGFGVEHAVTIGLQARADIITGLGLYRTQDRVRFATVRHDDVQEMGTGVFVQAESRWTSWVRSVLGMRADGYSFHVASDRSENSGSRIAAIVSPKASVILAPSGTTELYLSGGFGFHSNDARGTTITVDPTSGAPVSRVDPLVRSRGAEIGVRAAPVDGLRSTASLWLLSLDSELLFTGDAGTTEPSAGSRRRGVSFANFYRPSPELSLDADISFAQARFSGVPAGQTSIPGALENVVAAGVTFSPRQAGVFTAVRLRHFGSYPLNEDNSDRAPASNLVNADIGYQLRSGTRVRVSVLNLLDGRADDIQYRYRSRLQGEPPEGIDDVHFHPAEPRHLRLELAYTF